jgi:hypothetical protein
MDLDIPQEQELRRRASARFIESSCPLTGGRALQQDERGAERAAGSEWKGKP